MKSLMLLAVALATPAFVWCGCGDFYDELRDNVPTGLPPCPCTASQARADSDFQEWNHGIATNHPGAASCFRSAQPTPEGAGQECCYDFSGSILVGPPGGGSADRYSPANPRINPWNHYWYDVRPWEACCRGRFGFANCPTYYRYRPSDDCSGYEPPN